MIHVEITPDNERWNVSVGNERHEQSDVLNTENIVTYIEALENVVSELYKLERLFSAQNAPIEDNFD